MNDKIFQPMAYALLGVCMTFAIPAGAQTLTPVPAIKTFTDTGSGTAPFGLTADSAGNVYFADSAQNVVMKVDATGAMTVVAGIRSTIGSSGNGGPANAALLFLPFDVTLDADGNNPNLALGCESFLFSVLLLMQKPPSKRLLMRMRTSCSAS